MEKNSLSRLHMSVGGFLRTLSVDTDVALL